MDKEERKKQEDAKKLYIQQRSPKEKKLVGQLEWLLDTNSANPENIVKSMFKKIRKAEKARIDAFARDKYGLYKEKYKDQKRIGFPVAVNEDGNITVKRIWIDIKTGEWEFDSEPFDYVPKEKKDDKIRIF